MTVETEVRETWSSWPGAANLEMGMQVAHWGKQRTTIYYGKGLQNRTRFCGKKRLGQSCSNQLVTVVKTGRRHWKIGQEGQRQRNQFTWGTGWRHGRGNGKGGP